MEQENRLNLTPVEDFPHEKRTLAHMPPTPKAAIWPRVRRALARLGQVMGVLMLSTLVYGLASTYVVRSVEVSGQSMSPTLSNGDRFLLNMWGTRDYAPHRGDIVVLRDPVADCLAVKRIVGLAGESIYFRGGSVYVNNERLPESYLPKWTRTYPLDGAPSELYMFGTNRYFVLGDNRENSADSREYGPIMKGSIVGKLDQ